MAIMKQIELTFFKRNVKYIIFNANEVKFGKKFVWVGLPIVLNTIELSLFLYWKYCALLLLFFHFWLKMLVSKGYLIL